MMKDPVSVDEEREGTATQRQLTDGSGRDARMRTARDTAPPMSSPGRRVFYYGCVVPCLWFAMAFAMERGVLWRVQDHDLFETLEDLSGVMLIGVAIIMAYGLERGWRRRKRVQQRQLSDADLRA
jgi:hypothetical protein